MSLSTNFPNQWPTLLLDFANAKRLDPRITFTRATPAVYYDGITTAVAEQNLLLQSQSLAAGTWGVLAVTQADNAAVAPDGSTTATRVTETTATSEHYTSQSFSTFSGVFTFSVFLRKGTLATAPDWVQLACGGTNSGYVSVNLATGVIGNTGGFSSTAIQNVGSGWYRVSVSTTVGSGAISFRIGFSNNTNANTRHVTYAGSTTSDVLVWGAQVEQRSTATAYTVTTTTAVTNFLPVLLTASAGTARFDHNPVTGLSLGLLIEESRTNLLTNSIPVVGSGWNAGSALTFANYSVAPDGTNTASLIYETFGTSAQQLINTSVSVSSGTTYTFTAYAKYVTAQTMVMTAFGEPVANFNLITGVASGTGASMVLVGNGWYRCVYVVTKSNTTGSFFIGTNVNTVTGQGYARAVLVWGAQVEVGSFATSYIATAGSTQVRNADSALMTGTNFSSWYNPSSGTLLAQGTTNATGATEAILAEFQTTTADRMMLFKSTAATTVRALVTTVSVTQYDATATALVNGTVFMGMAYETNNFRAVFNGTLGTADNGASIIPVVDRLSIGNQSLAFYWNGTIAKISYYNDRLTDSQLQALTRN